MVHLEDTGSFRSNSYKLLCGSNAGTRLIPPRGMV